MGSRATAQGIEDHEIQICPRVLVSWSIGESMGSLGLRNIQLQLSQLRIGWYLVGGLAVSWLFDCLAALPYSFSAPGLWTLAIFIFFSLAACSLAAP